jgi:antagonist of KipI
VGNDDNAAALEVTLLGPELEAEGNLLCAVAGADYSLTAGESPVPMHVAFVLRSGMRLRFGSRTAGARATVAVRGGIAAEPLQGSRATSLISRMGPFGGRPLRSDDVLRVGTAGLTERKGAGFPLTLPSGGAKLRVISGPHEEIFTDDARAVLFGTRFVVSTDSNRMGYRLEGTALSHAGTADILSDATPIGSLQVPASGQPILLMADRQTTGGYPRIGTVITADLPLAGQLAPGDWIEFVWCSRAAAIEALRQQRARLEGRRR